MAPLTNTKGIPENESNGGKLININFYLTDLLNFLIERKLETETLPNQVIQVSP